MTKEEKIKASYGEHWEAVRNFVDEDGWMFIIDFPTLNNSVELQYHINGYSLRPKSLKGIENNNGWNTIPSIHEKEIEKGQYWVIYPNGFIEVAYYDGTMECYKFWKLNFTHYQPIEKPKPPLF